MPMRGAFSSLISLGASNGRDSYTVCTGSRLYRVNSPLSPMYMMSVVAAPKLVDTKSHNLVTFYLESVHARARVDDAQPT